jgi:PQQ-like domain/Abnormal spindle-like microcephaly-assoc'd, ASPM-SPD-2-Hydin
VHIRGYFRSRSRSVKRLVLVSTGLALVAGMLPVVDALAPIAHADDVTASQNVLRDGWDSSEPGLNPTTVSTFSGTPTWNATVDGDVYAQPLVLGSTVIVATENDNVYGLDAGTGAILWELPLGSPYAISSDPTLKACTDLVPNIGVTGTPAYDSVSGDIYLFADIMNGSSPEYYMVQVTPNGGSWANPTPTFSKTPITGSPSNDSHVTFSGRYNMERPGVLVTGGAVYGAFASHCDHKPYDGFVARVDISTSTPKVTLWSDESGVTYNQAGIWQSGGGIMSDGAGRIFVASGNGVSPVKRAGTSPGGQLAESVIRLGVNSNGTLSARDFFSPAVAPSWDASDKDYGSAGPAGVPFPVGTYSALVQPGKSGQIWLLNRASLGGREQGPSGTDKDLFVTKAYGGVWGHPAIFGNTPVTIANSHTNPVDNDFLFTVGKNDVMRVFRFAVNSTGKPLLTNLATSSLTYQSETSGSPVVTSNGSDPSSAVIWEVYTPSTTTRSGAGSALEAYELGKVASNGTTPSPCTSAHVCTLTNIWHSDPFTSAKFSIPATSQGWVYVGTRDGHVLAWAAPGATAPAVATTAAFPQTAVGTTSSHSVSITAKRTVIINGATASTGATNAGVTASEFGVSQVSVTKNGASTAFPVTLHKGDKLTVQTTFTPTVPGGSTGTLSLSTSSSRFPIVAVPLTAEGTQDGLYALPSTQTFPLAPDQGVIPVPLGIKIPETVNISNFGPVTQTITSITPPSAPFTTTNMPTVGTKIIPGETITVQVTYAPTSIGTSTGSFTIAGSSGTPAVVNLSGLSTSAQSQLTAADPVINFGNIRAGKKAVAYVQFTNTGNTESLVQRTSAVVAPFGTPLKPAVGMPFNPDSDMLLPVTFTPTKKGTFTTHYKIVWSDVNGKHTLTVTLTGEAS